MSKSRLMKVLYYCPESDYYYDSDEEMTRMRDHLSRFEVLQKVKKLINRVRTTPDAEISEAGSSKEESINSVPSLRVPSFSEPSVAEPSLREPSIAQEPVQGSIHSINNMPAAQIDEVSLSGEDSIAAGQDDTQSAMVDIGCNLHSQLTRLQIAPSVKDWNSVARFLLKANILDDLEKAALLANERAEQKFQTPQ